MTQTVGFRTITFGLTLGLLLSAGCKPTNPPAPVSSAVSESQSQPPGAVQAKPFEQTMVPGTIYTAAADCVTFVPQTVELPKNDGMTAAVGKVLESQPAIASTIASYTVDRSDSTAVIDFQLKPQAQRSISSLSLCEQFALFGSLRETLVQTSDWGIKTVYFTQDGKQLGL